MTELAAVLAGLGGAALVLACSRVHVLAALAVTAVATTALAVDLLGGELPDVGPAATVLEGLLAVGTALGGAALLIHFPAAVLPALVLAAPLRLPIAADSSSPLLFGFVESGGLGRLYPFYGVLVPAVIALVWTTWRDSERDAALRPYMPIALPLAALVGLAGASALWSSDIAATADQLVFFWLPFTVAFAVAARIRTTPPRQRLLAIVLVGSASAFAAVGIWQAATHQLFFYTAALAEVNAHGPLFRVTSVFQDPSHYGRWLVLGIVVVFVALWTGRLRVVTGAVLSLLMLAGLVFSYSQSSIVAMVVVLLALAVAGGDRGARRVAIVVAAGALLVGGAALAVAATGDDFERFSRERSRLALDTARVAAAHPLVGVGLGAQAQVTQAEQNPAQDEPHNASHTTPFTVAAELGVLGLAAYLALIVGAARALLDVRRVNEPMALGLGAVLLALLVHSLLYAGFFDNPVVWGTLGLAGGAAVRARASDAREGAP